jgi:PilZ domain-containing protein
VGREHRRHRRRKMTTPGCVFGINGKPIVQCRVHDISASGVQIVLEREAELPAEFMLAMSHNGRVRRSCTLVWQFSIMAGARFAQSVEESQMAVGG